MMDPRTQMFSDVIITAVEGGTGYWAVADKYRWSDDDSYPATVTLIEQDSAGGFDSLNREPIGAYPVTVHGIAAAMYRIAFDPTIGVSNSIQRSVTVALVHTDYADLDADAADAIVQVLIFGDLVYG